jgi:hypothetical protein
MIANAIWRSLSIEYFSQLCCDYYVKSSELAYYGATASVVGQGRLIPWWHARDPFDSLKFQNAFLAGEILLTTNSGLTQSSLEEVGSRG